MRDRIDRKLVLLLAPHFGIETVRTQTAVVVTVSGEVDLCTSPWLAQELLGAQQVAAAVIVDLEQVEFMDCSGLRVLARFATADRSHEGRFSVTPGPPQVQRLFELTGMGRTLHVVAPTSIHEDHSASAVTAGPRGLAA